MIYIVEISLVIVAHQILVSKSLSLKDGNSWADEYPACGGEHQSPIDIPSQNVINKTYDPPFIVHNEDVMPLSMTLNNVGTGLKLEFRYPTKKTDFITGGPLTHGYYVLGEISFVWNRKQSAGSAHTVDGKSYALEMYADYYRIVYESIDNAQNFEDGIITITSFWEESSFEAGTALSKITSKLSEVIEPGSHADVEPFKFSELRKDPGHTTTYFAYNGSQLIPPCAPVTWIISDYIYSITSDQLGAFQAIKFENDDDDHNARPVQPLNGREIFKFTKELEDSSLTDF
ncbi:carbonic anhydrase 7-like [Chelonus insularis]|uniref:carbonic anhydrase 7-like n=1 Tax=Chelonus insularis TaxID=460826 RepID=UPI00158B8B75|nr:carbonic anhydrase 7-like [Chelonus insularis]